MSDQVQMMISTPPKYAVSQVIGYIKGKSAIYIARTYSERKRNYVGQHYWARGYFVSTVGRDEDAGGVRRYSRVPSGAKNNRPFGSRPHEIVSPE